MSSAYNINPNVFASENDKFNNAVDQLTMKINTCLPCKIVATNGINFDIQPIVSLIDSQDKEFPHGIIRNVPYVQIAGGIAGIIISPEIGDIVLGVFSQRDITEIKNDWQNGRPDSNRKFNLADAICIGLLSNNKPTTYIKITKNGIEMQSQDKPITINNTNDITVNTKNLNITTSANTYLTTVNATITASGDTKINTNNATVTAASNITFAGSNINFAATGMTFNSAAITAGSGASYAVVTSNSVILDSVGKRCTVTNYSTNVKLS